MKPNNKITAAAVLLFISVFSAATAVSGMKNSGTGEFPRITWKDIADGSTGEDLSRYMADNFAGRDIWLAANARINYGICEGIVNGVFISDSRLLSADPPSANTNKAVTWINDLVSGYDGAAYFAAIPTSAGIYGDLLPSYLQTSAEKQQIDNLYSQLDTDIKKIDAYSILKMLSDNYIYYRSDEKWTSYGAYCVYRTVIQKLGFLPVSYDKYTIRHVTDDYKGDLYRRAKYMKSKPDLLDIYEYPEGAAVTECIGYNKDGKPRQRSLYDTAAASKNGYDLYMGRKDPVVKISTSVNNDRQLLVIGDDYAACFIPFLTQHYSSITVVFPQYTERTVKELVDTGNYEQMLFLFGINDLNDLEVQ